jgi:hypothetical protein
MSEMMSTVTRAVPRTATVMSTSTSTVAQCAVEAVFLGTAMSTMSSMMSPLDEYNAEHVIITAISTVVISSVNRHEQINPNEPETRTYSRRLEKRLTRLNQRKTWLNYLC